MLDFNKIIVCFSLIVFVSNALAQDKEYHKCVKGVRKALAVALDYRDVSFVRTLDSEILRLMNLSSEMSAADLEKFFGLVKSKEDLFKLQSHIRDRSRFWYENLQEFVNNLAHLERQHPNVTKALWSNDGKKPAKDVLDGVLNVAMKRKRLHKSDGVSIQQIAEFLYRVEDSVLTRAARKKDFPRSLGTRLKESIFSYYKRVQKILEANDYLLERIQLSKKIDVAAEAIVKNSEHLNGAEKAKLLRLLADTEAELLETKLQIQRVYGVDPKNGTIPKPEEVDVFAVYQQAKSLNADEKTDEMHRKMDATLTEIDSIIDKARAREGAPARQPKDYVNEELSLRHEFNSRKGFRMLRRGRELLNRNTAEHYSVEDRRTRTVYSHTTTDSKGNSTRHYKTETYYVTVTHYPDYEEVLYNSFSTGDRSVWGLDEVRHNTARVRNKEWPLRNKFSDLRKEYEEAIANYSNYKNEAELKNGHLKRIKDMMKRLDQIELELSEYVKWGSDKAQGQKRILEQWDHDDPVHFLDRNRLLLKRYKVFKTRLQLLEEQIKRGVEDLNIRYIYPDRDEEMEILRRQRNIEVTMRIGVTGTAGALGYAAFSKWDQIKELFHDDDPVERGDSYTGEEFKPEVDSEQDFRHNF